MVPVKVDALDISIRGAINNQLDGPPPLPSPQTGQQEHTEEASMVRSHPTPWRDLGSVVDHSRVKTDSMGPLLREGKIDLSCAGDTLRLGLLFHPFVPCDQVVLAIRDVSLADGYSPGHITDWRRPLSKRKCQQKRCYRHQ